MNIKLDYGSNYSPFPVWLPPALAELTVSPDDKVVIFTSTSASEKVKHQLRGYYGPNYGAKGGPRQEESSFRPSVTSRPDCDWSASGHGGAGCLLIGQQGRSSASDDQK